MLRLRIQMPPLLVIVELLVSSCFSIKRCSYIVEDAPILIIYYAKDVNRKDYRAWYGLGQTYELLGEPFYALNYYQKATALR